MKLEELLGSELYAQVKAKIDEKNASEPDKLKHVRYADLSEGEYVGKGKYDTEMERLNNIISGKDTELTSANDLIAQLKKDSKGNEDMQGKITAYEGQVKDLQKQLEETKLNAAIKVALMSEKPVDVEYLTFKLHEKMAADNAKIELDDNGNIKGWDRMLESLKTQCPSMFNADQQKKIEEKKLPNDPNTERKSDPKSLEDALRMTYESDE